MKRLLLRLVVRWETLLVVAIIGVGFWSATLSPFFFTRINLLDLITPYVFIGLLAFGLTFVVIAGEIDISITSILAVSVVSFAQLLDHGVNVWVAMVAGLAVAAALGLVNGLLVALLNLPSLAVTLGTLAAFQGLAFVILSGEGVAEFPQAYLDSAAATSATSCRWRSSCSSSPRSSRARPPRHAIRPLPLRHRDNREAARLSGVPRLPCASQCVRALRPHGGHRWDRVRRLLRLRAGRRRPGLAARRRHSRRPRRREHLRRRGSMLGVFLALVLVAVLRNGMQLANLGGDTQNIVIGVLLLAAIVAGNLVRAAQEGAITAGPAPDQRKEVVRNDSPEAASASPVEPQPPKGR